MVEADGVPRLHRAWRGKPGDLTAELRAIDRYLRHRHDLRISETVVAGPGRWRARARRSCAVLGWRYVEVSRWAAHEGAAT